jgi:hypothetical protein
MSRRKRRPSGAPAPSGDAPRGGGAAPGAAGGRAPGAGRGRPGAARPAGRRIALDLAILIAVFAITAAIAELAGAANLGVALGVGQVAFALAVVVLLLRE